MICVTSGLGTRAGKTENSVSNTFRRSGAYVTDPVLGDGTASYRPGVSRRQGTSVSYQHGGLKNLDAQTSVSQSVTAARVYDAFGNVVTSTGAWAGPFGYAGGFGYQQDASGLKLLGHRYYDPSTGRFLTRDPIKDGRNWYAYGAGEAAPTTITDPNGLEPVTLIIAAVAVAAIVAYFCYELYQAMKKGKEAGQENAREAAMIVEGIGMPSAQKLPPIDGGGGDPSFWQDGQTPSWGNYAGDGDNINPALATTAKATIGGMQLQTDILGVILKPAKAPGVIIDLVKGLPKEEVKDRGLDWAFDTFLQSHRTGRWTRL